MRDSVFEIFDQAAETIANASSEELKQVAIAAEDPYVKSISQKAVRALKPGFDAEDWEERKEYILKHYPKMLSGLADVAIIASEALAFEEYSHGKA